MTDSKIIWTITGVVLFGIAIITIFIFFALPRFDSPAVAGIIGVLVGGFIGLLGSVVNLIVRIWSGTKQVVERLKDRVSNHALELTRMDYELRQKALESSGEKQQLLVVYTL
jgi:hypothetical protein